MPLQDLVAGECGEVNPFSQVTSHFVKDYGYRDERPHMYSSDSSVILPSSDDLLQQFLDEGNTHSARTFHMGTLLQEIRDVATVAPVQGPGVFELAARESHLAVPQDLLWAAEFLRSPVVDSSRQLGDNDGNDDEVPEADLPALHCNEAWLQDFISSCDGSATVESQSELQADDCLEVQEAAQQVVQAMDDKQFHYSQFMQFMKTVGEGDVSIEAGQVVDKKNADPDLDRAWSDVTLLDSHESTPEDELLQSWEQAFRSLLPASSRLQDSPERSWSQEFSHIMDPFTTYQFQEDNPMVGQEDPLTEGKKKLQADDVPSAVLCFEAAVQLDASNAEAWLLLGTSQAENEQDCAAIPALKKCLELEPGNLTALLTLATSYTNEGHQYQACQALKTWLQQNPRYCSLVPKSYSAEDYSRPMMLSAYLTRDVCRELQGLFMDAARQNPVHTIDPDVQSGLGVLFNLTNEYDKAADCFRSALQVRRHDFRLWNRLGATLANGNRSEEAVEAYHHALRLSPGFIRARYNLGISCINLAAYREAAEHLLTALNQQAAGVDTQGRSSSRNMSSTIWTTLRLVVALLDRRDLYDAVDARDLPVLNREFGM